MDAKQLHETGRQISKVLDSGDPSSTVLSILSPLHKWTATEDLLRQSKIGVSVARLRQHKDPKVAAEASKLVNKWKNDVKVTARKSTRSPAPGSKANGASSGVSSPAPQKSEATAVKKESRKSTVDPAKRNSKEDGVSTAVTGNQTRDSCVKLMYDGLAFMSEEGPDEIMAVARSVELAAYNKLQPETSTEYKAKMRSLFQNLKVKGNSDLRQTVFNGSITAEKFINMSSDELKSEEKRKADAALEKENMRVAMTAEDLKAISTTMTCGKCKVNKVAYSQAQTRAADEPMTTFCECMNCGNRWKFS
nr:hypothetical protein B0A51_13914 [Rachicladosporium sp. CCFEE 5018]